MALRKNWSDEAYRLSLQGLNAQQISERLKVNYPGITYQAVRSSIRRDRKRNGTQRDCQGRPVDRESHKVREVEGNRIYEDLMPYEIGQNVTQEYVMEQKGLSIDDWEVVSFTKNTWQQQTKDGETINLCQSKLVVRPRKKDGLTLADLDKWFANKDFSKIPVRTKVNVQESKGLIAEICASDIHFGLLAWDKECGESWDLKIGKERFITLIRDLVERLKREDIAEVYFCTLGDVLHVDNVQGTTTKGTVQQVDGRIPKIFDFAYDTLNEALEIIRELNVPIHYIYVCGNHDMAMGYALVRALEIGNNDIDFDTKPNPQKAISFGNVLVGLNHGEIPNKLKGTWLLCDYGTKKFMEIHSGHIHTEEVKQLNNSTILERSVLAQTGSSFYEHSQGYRSHKGIQCFIWDKELGLRDIKYSIY